MSSRLFETIKNHPVNMVFTVIATILAVVFSFYQEYEQFQAAQLKKENLTLTKQVESLEKLQTSLGELMVFVDDQKKQLEEREGIIRKLESDKKRLEPLVNADREVVEALFETQMEMQKSNVWIDRIIGFFLGIAGSLIASLIWKSFHGK